MHATAPLSTRGERHDDGVVLRGGIVNRTKRCYLIVKIGKYEDFCVHRRSYVLWSPQIVVGIGCKNRNRPTRWELSTACGGCCCLDDKQFASFRAVRIVSVVLRGGGGMGEA